jgi:membrane fusion protein (multidrug efflux system)
MASGLESKGWQYAFMFLTALAVAGCGKQEAKGPAAPPVTEVGVVASPRDVPLTFEFVGETQSSQQVEIRARVNGFLEQRSAPRARWSRLGRCCSAWTRSRSRPRWTPRMAELAQQQARLTTARANLARAPLAAQERVEPEGSR